MKILQKQNFYSNKTLKQNIIFYYLNILSEYKKMSFVFLQIIFFKIN